MNIFDSGFITSLKSEIAKQLAANQEPVTRNTVLTALNLGLSADGLKDAELAVSLAFRLGLVPEYKMFQKIGIKSADYVPTSKKEKPKRRLNPKVQASTSATDTALATEEEPEVPEATDTEQSDA